MHGRERVARATPIGRVFAVSRTPATQNRTALLAGAVVYPVFPFGFALVTPDAGSMVFWVATALCVAISIAAVALDGKIRSNLR
jgi:cell division protein FtsW (lipid II flippase)